MGKNYEDWADWAGDHPEQAEAQLRAEREAGSSISLNHGLALAGILPSSRYAYDAEPGAKPEDFICVKIEGYSKDACEQAEAQLQGHSHDFTVGGANCWTCGEPKDCPHAEVDTQGVCENCGIEVPGWEPDDAQLLTQTGTKEPVA